MHHRQTDQYILTTNRVVRVRNNQHHKKAIHDKFSNTFLSIYLIKKAAHKQLEYSSEQDDIIQL